MTVDVRKSSRALASWVMNRTTGPLTDRNRLLAGLAAFLFMFGGGLTWAEEIKVLGVRENRVEFSAGSLAGIRVGMRGNIFQPGEKAGVSGPRVAAIRVLLVASRQSMAEITEPAAVPQVTKGMIVRLEGVIEAPLSLQAPDDGSAESTGGLLSGLKTGIRNPAPLKAAQPSGQPADAAPASISPTAQVQEWIRSGDEQAAAGAWGEAVAWYRKAYQLEPQYPGVVRKRDRAEAELLVSELEAAAKAKDADRMVAARVQAEGRDLGEAVWPRWWAVSFGTPGQRRLRAADGMEEVFIPGGSFIMGSSDEAARSRGWLEHKVTLTQEFWIDAHEVTVDQFRKVMGESPDSLFNQHGDWPVVDVDWFIARDYCRKVGGDLPTEAQWERAARGPANSSVYPWGDKPVCPGGKEKCLANIKGEEDGFSSLAPVCSFPPTGWGLCDLAGNAQEWMRDWRIDFQARDEVDPTGSQAGFEKVVRGGSWLEGPEMAVVFHRAYWRPNSDRQYLGFRCIRPLGSGGGR